MNNTKKKSMNKLILELKRTHEKKKEAEIQIRTAEQRIIAASNIQIGSKVKIIKNITKLPKTATIAIELQKYGNKLIGKETTIESIYIDTDGILSYTTAIRDEGWRKWCWSKEELELI